MPITGEISESVNIDKTKDFTINAVKELDSHIVSANMFFVGQRDKPDPMFINAPSYKAVGGGLDVENAAGHSVGVAAQHIPSFGNKATVSTNLNVPFLQTEKHKFDINAFTTSSMPKVGPNFVTHGAGVDYMFKKKFGANASVARTPMFKQTDYNIGGNINLHKTPTTSLDFNAGAYRTDTPFGRGNWEKQAFIKFTKNF